MSWRVINNPWCASCCEGAGVLVNAMLYPELPSLAALNVGAPTGMDGGGYPPAQRQRLNYDGDRSPMNDDDDDDDEPMDVEPTPAPPVPMPAHVSLVGLPPAVIAVMVQQAALTARKSETPAREICLWMRDFCRATTNAQLQCDDDLFRLALGAFGEVPEKATSRATFTDPMTRAQREARGQVYTGKVDALNNAVPAPTTNALPAWSGFSTWRSLFGALCDARNKNFRAPPNLFWRLSDDGTTAPYYNLPTSGMGAKFFKLTQSQRSKDVLLDAMLRRLLAEGAVSSQDMLQRVVTRWLGGERKTAPWMSEQSRWMAMVTWALLRGARPFQAEAHKQADFAMYQAVASIKRDSTESELTYATRRVKQALDAGADPNFYELRWRTLVGIARVAMPEDWRDAYPTGHPPVFLLALIRGNPDIIRLLVEAGASTGSGFQHNMARFYKAVTSYLRRRASMTDRPTTEKLLSMLGDFFAYRARTANQGGEQNARQMEVVDFIRLVRNWADHNNPWGHLPMMAELAGDDHSGPPTVPDWFLVAMRQAEERSRTPRRFTGERA